MIQERNERDFLDTSFEIAAPEYILFRYTLAGPLARFFALLIDHAILFTLFFVIAISFSIGGIFLWNAASTFSAFLFLLMCLGLFLVYWFYFLFLEWLNHGRTPGKMALGLRVVSIDGTALDVIQVMIRNLVRVADMFPFVVIFPTYITAGISVFLSGRGFSRLGDLAAGTIVVREQRNWHFRTANLERELSVADSDRIRALSADMHMRILPSAALSQGINDFAARFQRLHPARAEEIATAVEPQIRRYFGVERLQCTAIELLLAAHHHMFSMSRDELTHFELGRVSRN